MKNLLTTAALSAVTLAVSPAFAQTNAEYGTTDATYDTSDYFGPQEGQWEVTLAGTGGNDQDFDTGSFNIDVDASYYFSELLSAGVRQNVGYVDSNNSEDWNASTAVFGQAHFGDAALRPFVGASFGYLYGDGINETFFGGPEAGVRYYVKPEAFLFARASYQFLFDEGDEIDDQFETGRFLYTFGVGFTF